ncbi:DUF3800 domain-containing protein [Ignicoccus hospitalis]|uniref:DUF3800 domain-containing protein n=1 Tax=Ignicoccus hospitalis (strain KIN4/I / DSM 18386 / JCM 14125) TaxID=453591 RepID=A8AA97_IGNH4|nr:DUF3800 domain-containing protein [Ignicoccus hospitalis]ABU81849.1 hypothetical protein Igni_0667 [Ignicoccus hospitalis KIN4/I]HIH90117.1 DUF3800 domain-containing protein [Desulfurococcaceae archaeon]
MIVVAVDESGDTNVALERKGRRTRYFVTLAVVLDEKCYSIVTKELTERLREAVAEEEPACSNLIPEMLKNEEELKYYSITKRVAECVARERSELKVVNEKIDNMLAKFINKVRPCGTFLAVAAHVDKATIARKLKSFDYEIASSLASVIRKSLKPLVLKEFGAQVCRALDGLGENAIVILDEKFVPSGSAPKGEYLKKHFPCERVIEAFEVKSHQSSALALADIMAAAYRNCLLHGNEALCEALSFVEGRDLTEHFLRRALGLG